MTGLAPVVFLLDVNYTLLDNDRVVEDLKDHLTLYDRREASCGQKKGRKLENPSHRTLPR